MRIFDFSGNLARLNDSFDTLKAAWAETSTSWDDSTGRRFYKERLEPLEPILRRASSVIQRLGEMAAQAERELSDT
ncbi:MAG: hypothetical protein HQ582_15215 [Planctomycetes bacterium]|nr:hypothetical protein [Planctomycetota bacterium]